MAGEGETRRLRPARASSNHASRGVSADPYGAARTGCGTPSGTVAADANHESQSGRQRGVQAAVIASVAPAYSSPPAIVSVTG